MAGQTESLQQTQESIADEEQQNAGSKHSL